jgi:hypothetical protein
MDPRSEGVLAHVHADIGRVMRAADQAPQAFVLIQGLRAAAAEAAAIASGHSQTSHSRHLPDPHYGGVAMAVDLWPLIGGQLTAAPGREAEVFGAINVQIAAACAKLKLPPLMWGGAKVGAWAHGKVSGFRDWDHWQLDPEFYP